MNTEAKLVRREDECQARASKMSVVDLSQIGVGRFIAPGRVDRPVRTHEFNWVVNGAFEFVRDGELRTVPAGVLAFDAPGPDVSHRWGSGDNEIFWVQFECDDQPWAPVLTNLSDHDVVVPLLEHLRWLSTDRRGEWRPAAVAVIDYLIRAIATGLTGRRPRLPENWHPAIEKTFTYLQALWDGGPRVAPPLISLATASGISAEHLTRVFSAGLGLPPITLIRLLRMNRAALLLTRTSMRIRDIAEECGFVNEYHFSMAFKRVSGTSPTAFRSSMAELALPPVVADLARRLG
jgi:AraC-like DNA-binding protein